MKQKLLLALLALFTLGGSNLFAQEDITSQYLTNADLSTVDNGWTYYSDAFKYTDWKTDGDVPVVEFYSQWNSGASVSITQKDFKFSQTITLPAGDYRIAVNAFYRNGAGDGTNPDKAWIFAGEKKQNVAALTSAGVSAYTGSNDLYKAANAFSLGDFSNAFDFSLESETEIEVGFQGFFNTSLSWCILGPVKLYKYSLDDYLEDYRAKVAEAKALYDSKMNAEVLQALKNAVVEESTFTLSSQITEAIATLTAKINDANNSISVYSDINSAISNYTTKANALDDNGKSAYETSVSGIQTKYDNGTYVTLEEAENELSAAFINAIKAQTTIGSDWTLVIVNPSFENGFSSGWTNSGMDIQSNTSFDKDGNNYCEKWQPNGTVGVSQILNAMPAGVYELTAKAKTRGVTYGKFFADEVETSTKIADEVNTYTVEFACDANANVTIGFEGKGTGAGSSWIALDDFHLTLVSAGLPDVTAVTGKMNADVAAAQALAIETYNNDRTIANYNAAVAAINAARASVEAYEKLVPAFTEIDAALSDATSATASTEAYNKIKTAYNEGTIADADIMTNFVNAYDAVIPVIKSQTASIADFTLAIQNHSFEYGDLTGWTVESSSDTGVRETANATYAASGSDGKYLFNTWWKGNPITQVITGLPNGQYTLTVSVSSDGATIYLIANGEHNDGIETGGNYPSSDTFQETSFTFLVKDGNATIGAVGGANGDAGVHKDYVEDGYWWYKADNFRLVKNRELTEEELAVIPTGIELDKETIELTVAENTVTLTPTFDPENATTTVTWASSDENVATVADGVVTGVAPGTATITVASTLDADVKATCTVTVSYPESVVPETYYENDGATRTVYTLGENLIKNGSFEYPNPVYAWTASSNYSTAALASNFTISTTGGMYDGAYLTGNGVGAADQKSLTKLIPVEAGKTYYFSVYTSGKAPNTNNQNYNALFKLTSEKKEDGTITKFNWPQGADKETSDWNKTEFIFTADDSHPYVGIRLSWAAGAKFDEFILAEVSSTTEGNVDYATGAIPTANIGTGVFQYSQDAIDAANALVQGEATVEDVEAAYEALTTLNSPAEGQLYNIVVAEEGNARNGNAIVIVPGATSANNPTGYGLNVTLAPNTNLNQAVTFTKVSGNNYNISFETAAGTAYLTTGSLNGSAAGWKTQQIQATNDAEKKCAFTIVASTEDNVFYIYNPEHKDYIDYQDGGALYTDTNIDHKAFSLVETSKPSIDINTTAAGWGTTILPFAAQKPADVKVYSCAEVNGSTLTLAEVDALEANKPYIIEGAWNATLTGNAQGTALTYTEGLLTGTYERIAAPNGSYVLQKHDDKVGFFKVDTSVKQPNVPANRAYLTVSNSSAKAFYFGGDATGISAIEALMNGDAEIYNVSGVKQNTLQKGINIIKTSDGKTHKIMVK